MTRAHRSHDRVGRAGGSIGGAVRIPQVDSLDSTAQFRPGVWGAGWHRAWPRGWSGAALAAWTLLAVAAVICMLVRARFAYGIEWMEGNQWYAAFRMAHGLAIYADPGESDFLPHPYPPLQPALAAAAMRAFGDSLAVARGVSIVCTLLCAAVVAGAVLRAARDRISASFAACLFLGAYFILDTWYDLIRVDMVYALFVLAGFAVWAQRPRSTVAAILGLGLVAASSFAKQPGLVVVVAALAAGIVERRRRWLVVTSAVIAATIVAHVLLDAATGGWYRYWVWEVPSHHALAWNALVPGGLARAAWIAALPLAVSLAAHRSQGRGHGEGHAAAGHTAARRAADRVWWIALAATFLACSLSYAKVGATINNWLPFAAVTAVVTGRALAGRPWPRIVPFLLLVQAGLCIRDPRTVLPTAADRAAGARITASIAAIPGDVWVMDDAYLAHRAGKTPHMGGMTLGDLHYAGQPTPPTLLARIRRHEFAAIVSRYDATDPRHTHPVAEAIRDAYGIHKVAIPYASEREFLPVAGGRYKPRWILYPNAVN